MIMDYYYKNNIKLIRIIIIKKLILRFHNIINLFINYLNFLYDELYNKFF